MVKKLIILVCLISIGFIVGGCGATFSEDTGYYDPTWSTDGRILAVKTVTKYQSQGFPGYGSSKELSYAQYIVSMKDDGSEERILYGGEGKTAGIPVASPLGNYIGYISGEFINIITADGTKEIKNIDCGESINSFDWSPDETRIAFAGEDSHDLYLINVSDEVKIKLTGSAESVAWRVGEKIVFSFADTESSKIYSINITSTSLEVIASVGGDPQISNLNKVVYGGYGLQVKQVDIDGKNDALLFDGYQRSTLKLSFDNHKIVGGDLEQRTIKGIWVMNIDGTGSKKLRE